MRLALTTCVLCALAFGAVAQKMLDDPIAVLQSDAGFDQKTLACHTLQRYGGEDAVPILAALLTDEKLSHIARLAMETMPFPSVDEALRDALAKTEGTLRIGIINSLGHRKDTAAVPALIEIVNGDDVPAAQASARALGRIANAEAVQALTEAASRSDLDETALEPFIEALLDTAEHAAKAGDTKGAVALYDRVRTHDKATAPAKAAALRGSALAQGADGIAVVLEGARAESNALFDAALRTAQEMDEDGLSSALAGVLPELPADRKIRLMQVLGELGDPAAGAAIVAEAQGEDTAVRVAALAAATRLGYEPILEVASNLLTAEDGALAQAARNSISYFPGEAGDKAIRAMLESTDAQTRERAVDLAGAGGLPSPVKLLMAAADDPAENVRRTALKMLRTHATQDELQPLLDILLGDASPEERGAAENALIGLCARLSQATDSDITIVSAAYGDLPNGQQADVTAKVAELANSGKVTIEASNTNFGDPAPNTPKQLGVSFTVNGTTWTKTVDEGGSLSLSNEAVPEAVTKAILAAHKSAEGETRNSTLRLLRATGSPEALAAIIEATQSSDEALRTAALDELSQWPTLDALEPVMAMALESPNANEKDLGMRGAVRLLRSSGEPASELLPHYTTLLAAADTEGQKLVLGALGDLSSKDAFDMVLRHITDDAVRAEAVQAATAIAEKLGTDAQEDTNFFHGTDLSGWSGPEGYWSVKEGAIVGHSDTDIPKNTFIWSDGEQSDFYLVLDVKLEPDSANAGIQFRSKKVDDYGQAVGYQADMGAEVWGRLYHEHGRGKLFWDGRGERAVKPNDWNRYEILAVGPAIWTAINGKLGVALVDDPDLAERTGHIAFQIHGGPPQTASYRIVKLVHNPKVAMEGMDAKKLINALEGPE
ncbi:MAG: HEAT repeat domain-containing protein [Candidatus Hydrogenedentes bacterium]|nr:HEAT repeat domain-containing protein [Candidatus Hydrogenedentota bacterium]